MSVNSQTILNEMERRMRNDDWFGALEVFEKYGDLTEHDSKILWSVGWVYFKLNDLRKSEVFLRKAVDVEPVSATSLGSLGVVLREQEKYEEAEDFLIRALAIEESYMTRRALAIMYMELERLGEAEKVLREGLKLKQNHRERVEALAHFLWDTGQRKEADELYELAKQMPTREERRKLKRKRSKRK
jgi:tetratricopeptide (TPR) repeat protein